jgi:hypothetical protein
LDAARRVLGTAAETETIELVVFGDWCRLVALQVFRKVCAGSTRDACRAGT